MSRVFRVAAATAALTLSTSAFAYEASTTRIETRAFYGATVTLEAGVRVFRPLPPHSKVIINPGGKTPLSLSFEENRNYNYNHDSGSRSDDRSDNSSDDNGSSFGGFGESGGKTSGKSHERNGLGAVGKPRHAGPTPQRVSHPAKPQHHGAPAKH